MNDWVTSPPSLLVLAITFAILVCVGLHALIVRVVDWISVRQRDRGVAVSLMQIIRIHGLPIFCMYRYNRYRFRRGLRKERDEKDYVGFMPGDGVRQFVTLVMPGILASIADGLTLPVQLVLFACLYPRMRREALRRRMLSTIKHSNEKWGTVTGRWSSLMRNLSNPPRPGDRFRRRITR